MKKFNFLIMIFVLLIVLQLIAHASDNQYKYDENEFENLNFALEHGVLFVRPNFHSEEKVEIDHEYHLYVNGKRIVLTDDQHDLVKSYYNTYMDLTYSAENLGKKATKLGLLGTEMGIKAAFGVLEVMLTDCEIDDLKEDLEVNSDEIKSFTEKLEEEAERIEEIAGSFKLKHRELRTEITLIGRLSWF